MKSFLGLCSAAGGAYGLAILHTATRLFLPPPLHSVNTVFAVLVIFLVARQSGTVVWMSFGSYLFLEQYSTLPFGLTLTSATLGMLGTVWLYQQIFTNRSWYAAAILSLAGILLYRIIYSLGITFIHILGWNAPSWTWQTLARGYALEAGTTALIVAVLYWLLGRMFPSLRAAEISV